MIEPGSFGAWVQASLMMGLLGGAGVGLTRTLEKMEQPVETGWSELEVAPAFEVIGGPRTSQLVQRHAVAAGNAEGAARPVRNVEGAFASPAA